MHLFPQPPFVVARHRSVANETFSLFKLIHFPTNYFFYQLCNAIKGNNLIYLGLIGRYPFWIY